MGRRSINTTKSGKYMNPTDQARKEARKKELKKNKKQRQMVRQAVLKNKDPSQLLEEMEKIDEMEYNVLQPSPLNEKVLKEKRKKLKETFDRVMRLLHEEELEQWQEMKRKEVEYEKRKYKRVQYYESVRHAEQVSIEDIPLPSSTSDKPIPATMPKISLPPPILLTNVPPPISLKRGPDEESTVQETKDKEPPGIPATLPPNLFEMRELDSDYESEHGEAADEEMETAAKDEAVKDKHDKNIEDFLIEVESVQQQKKKKDEERALELRIDPTPEVEIEEKSDEITRDKNKPEEEVEEEEAASPITREPEIPKAAPEAALPLPSIPPMAAIPRMPPHPHPLIFRPPPLRTGMQMGIRMPPGPPPGPRPNMGGMQRMGIRMPPGPPLGPPPLRHKGLHHDRGMPPQQKQSSTTITAKPQIRNLSADVTRFVPTTLRTKRDEPKKVKPKSYIPETQMQQVAMQHQQQQQQQKPTKDDAYLQFMNELQDLL